MSTLSVEGTLLEITGLALPPKSAYGITQTLEFIGQAESMRRTVNGELDDLSESVFRKFRSTISGTTMRSPSFNDAYPGKQVTVDCVVELSYPEPEGGEEEEGEGAIRTIVPGSYRISDGFIYYRPRLTMRIMQTPVSRPEWSGEYSWSIELEEV